MEKFLFMTTELREYHALRIAMLFGPLEISCKAGVMPKREVQEPRGDQEWPRHPTL